MSIITLITDFGVQDEFVGVMKGVILSINPEAVVVDITHGIDPQNLIQCAHLVPYVHPYFPKKTIHVVVVDPGVGSDRAVVALKKNGHLFLAPDNGVLTVLMADGKADALFRVDNTDYCLYPISHTFHGRDIFAPVAAHLSKGVSLESMGPPMDVSSLVRLPLDPPYVSKQGNLVGRVIHVDRFGNLMTDLRNRHLADAFSGDATDSLCIRIRDVTVCGIATHYDAVLPGQPVAVFGSRGFLEIAINRGDAAKQLAIQAGETVRINQKRS